MSDGRGPATLRLAGAAAGLGVLAALGLKAFEWAVDEGTDWIWNDVFDTDEHRWVVVPLALALGVGLAALIVATGQPRLPAPETDALGDEGGEIVVPSLGTIGIIAVVGLASLLAGASLGPEASLVAVASGIGLWIGSRAARGPAVALLQLASIGALLVAFVGSLLIVLLPLLILAKRRQLRVSSAVPVIVAGCASYATLWSLDRPVEGFGSIPVEGSFVWIDVLVAAGVGFLAAVLGWLLKRSISGLHRVAVAVDRRVPWPLAGALFGLVLGLLYLAGGQSVEFNGSAGSELLLDRDPPYGTLMLVVILVSKLLATAWSLAAGYRGGLVFPSAFAGVAVALIALSVFDASGPGVLIGAVAGVFAALTGPVAALVFVAALIPFELIGVAIVGIIGAAIGSRVLGAAGFGAENSR